MFQFIWRPYREFQHNVKGDKTIWSANTYLICFHVVEMHQTNRVKLQFGIPQDTPPEPNPDIEKFHLKTLKVADNYPWREFLQEVLDHWGMKTNHVLGESTFPFELQPNHHDNLQFRRVYKDVLFLSEKGLMNNPTEQLNHPITPQPPIHHNHSTQLQTYPTQTTFQNNLTPHLIDLALALHQSHMTITKLPLPKIFNTTHPNIKVQIQQLFNTVSSKTSHPHIFKISHHHQHNHKPPMSLLILQST